MAFSYSSECQALIGMFVAAMVTANCIRRTYALVEYGPSLTYAEGSAYKSFSAGLGQFTHLLVVGPMTQMTVLRILNPSHHPKQGDPCP
jgi:hypothetical protein